MSFVKKILAKIFIDGFSGMALGLFSTLIVGTILEQIARVIPGTAGTMCAVIANVAKLVMGAGIGCGVAFKLKTSPLVMFSAAVCGMVGAYAAQILAGTFLAGNVFTIKAPGEPLGAFVGAIVGIFFGNLIANKTPIDILLTPVVSIVTGSIAALFVGPAISNFMTFLGGIINWGVEQQPVLMGVVVSVFMGIFLTAPISSAAIGISLGLSGLAAGAATVGCCANMIGFAAASWRENGIGGALAQGLGTSMLQVPNIVRKPAIWLPAIIASAILGPIGTTLIPLESNAIGSGMGTAGLVGPIMTFQTMAKGGNEFIIIAQMLLLYFVLPALIAWGSSELLRSAGVIADGDMKLDVD